MPSEEIGAQRLRRPARTAGKATDVQARSVKEVVGQKTDTVICKPLGTRPAHGAVSDGPYLVDDGPNGSGKWPSPDKTRSHARTHSVYQEIIAKAYRRGLRIRDQRRIVADSLGFLFGER